MNHVVIISCAQQSNGAMQRHVSILPQTLLPTRLPHNFQQSSLCYIGGLVSTPFMCAIQWLLQYYINKDVQPSLLIPECFPHPTRNPVRISSHSPLLPLSRQPLIYFLSPGICLFWIFHINCIK